MLVCVGVGGTQRVHCDVVVSLQALESGTLSSSESQTIYNSQLVLILLENSISCSSHWGGREGKDLLWVQCELKY